MKPCSCFLRLIASPEPVPKLCRAFAAILLVILHHRLHSRGPAGEILVGAEIHEAARLQRRHGGQEVDVRDGHGAALDKAAGGHLVDPHEGLLQGVDLLRFDGRRFAKGHRVNAVAQTLVESACREKKKL